MIRWPLQTTTATTKTRHHRRRIESSHAPGQNEARLGSGLPPRVRLREVAQSRVDILPVASERAPIWSLDGSPWSRRVWTRCCDDKTLLAAIREQREQSSISPSSNPRSSIDFLRMRNGRRERAQSDTPRRPHSVCVCARMCAHVHACACVCVRKRQNQNRTNGCQSKVTTLVNHYLCSSIKAHMMAGRWRWPVTLQRKTTGESVGARWAPPTPTRRRETVGRRVFKSQEARSARQAISSAVHRWTVGLHKINFHEEKRGREWTL